MRNHGSEADLLNLFALGWKTDMAAMLALRLWGMKTQLKSVYTEWTFWINCYRGIIFPKFSVLCLSILIIQVYLGGKIGKAATRVPKDELHRNHIKKLGHLTDLLPF